MVLSNRKSFRPVMIRIFCCIHCQSFALTVAYLWYHLILQILWRGQEAMAETMKAEEWDKGAGIRVVERSASNGTGDAGLG